MIIIGVDPHPGSHTVAALDPNGTVLDHLRLENAPEAHERLLAFGERLGAERRWAVEGAGNPFVAPLVAYLLSRGERVVDVPPGLTSQYRSRRGSKKNDSVDAQNAARALMANPRLPAYAPGPDQRRLQVITRNRSRLAEDLKANKMALKALPSPEGGEGPAGGEERAILEELVACLARQIGRLDALLGELLEGIMPEILEVRGVGPVLGATILAEVGSVGRFEKEGSFASYCGAAPVDRSSGKTSGRVGVNPGGNRRMNYVLHMMAQVRLRTDGGSSRALVQRKQREGKTLRGALRVLKTYIARELYRTLKRIEESRGSDPVAA